MPTKLLEEAGIDIVPNPFGRRMTEKEIIEHIKGVDGLIAGLEPLNRQVLSSSPRLKAIARVGIGMTNVDQDAAKELGIKVSNTPDAPVQAVAEMTVAALLAICRDLVATNKALHAGEWKKTIGTGLVGTSILFVGYGRIGKKTAEILKSFSAKILVNDPFVDPATLENGTRQVSLDEGLRQAQVVSLHASGETVIIGKDEFSKMQDGVVLLNSARGELVDEEALIEALDSAKVSGAWFDAFWREPYKGRLQEYDQVLMTPHAGTYTRQCRLTMETQAVENLLRDLAASA